ncbi:MAG: hypothetical protein IPK33_08460 [Gemmatimonadetes bacterium]|nr:hypothetical protein [Gemmatimonadota bacterium]
MPPVELKDFIGQVRDEVMKAYDARSADPLFVLTEVELEVAFTLAGSGAAKGKLFVVDLEGQVTAERVHKVVLKLTPRVREASNDLSSIAEKVRDGIERGRGLPLGQMPDKGGLGSLLDLPE